MCRRSKLKILMEVGGLGVRWAQNCQINMCLSLFKGGSPVPWSLTRHEERSVQGQWLQCDTPSGHFVSGMRDRLNLEQQDHGHAASGKAMKWGGIPGGGGGLSGLPLDLGLLAQLPPQGRLHLGRNVWGRLANLHGRFQQLDGAAPVGLHLQWVFLLQLAGTALGGQGRASRWGHLGEGHAEAILHRSWQSLAPPHGPAQLPKDKERDYQKGEATETYDHGEETYRDVYT